MGFRPALYLTTREMRRVEPLFKGDRCKAGNPFEWGHVKFNLPGNDAYNPSKPRVYKVRKYARMVGLLGTCSFISTICGSCVYPKNHVGREPIK